MKLEGHQVYSFRWSENGGEQASPLTLAGPELIDEKSWDGLCAWGRLLNFTKPQHPLLQSGAAMPSAAKTQILYDKGPTVPAPLVTEPVGAAIVLKPQRSPGVAHRGPQAKRSSSGSHINL